jgi:hypothetical protein
MMAPPLSTPHGASGGATLVIIDHGRWFTNRLAITGLSVTTVVVGLAFHGIAAIHGFFVGWASVPRPRPGSLPHLVAVPVWAIDTLDHALRRVSGSIGGVVHATESPLRRVLEASADRIVSLGGRG